MPRRLGEHGLAQVLISLLINLISGLISSARMMKIGSSSQSMPSAPNAAPKAVHSGVKCFASLGARPGKRQNLAYKVNVKTVCIASASNPKAPCAAFSAAGRALGTLRFFQVSLSAAFATLLDMLIQVTVDHCWTMNWSEFLKPARTANFGRSKSQQFVGFPRFTEEHRLALLGREKPYI